MKKKLSSKKGRPPTRKAVSWQLPPDLYGDLEAIAGIIYPGVGGKVSVTAIILLRQAVQEWKKKEQSQ